MKMNILIRRQRYSKHGVDGTLSIRGQYVCNTCENPFKYLPAGTYKVQIETHRKLRRKVPTLPCGAILRPGNGPFCLHDRSIIVGERLMEGVLVRSAQNFNRLIDRLDKSQQRGDVILLTII